MPSIRSLRIFREVCHTGNLTRAAENLFMTQPAVSQTIKELEKSTGLNLFDRLSHRLVLTPTGEIYLEKVLHLLAVYDDLADSPGQVRQQATLRLGACITVACHWLPSFLQKSRNGEEYNLQIAVQSAEDTLAQLRSHALDCVLHEGIAPNEPYCVRPLFQYRLLAVCPADHPFAQRKRVSMRAFLQQPLLLRETGSAVRDALDSRLYTEGLRANPVMTSVNSQAIIQCVEGGFGLSLLPEPAVSAALAKGKMASFAVEGLDLYNQASLVYHQQKHMTHALAHFVEDALAYVEGKPAIN